MVKVICFVFITWSIGFKGYSQAFTTAFKESREKLAKLDNFRYKIEFKSIAEDGSIVVEEFMQIERVGSTYYSKLGSIESYRKDSLSIIVDHESKTVLVNRADSVELTIYPKRIDQIMLNAMNEVQYEKVDTTATTINYRLFFGREDIKTLEYSVSKESFLMSGLEIELSQPSRNYEETGELPVSKFEIKINYLSFNNQSISKPLESYLELNNGILRLKDSIKNYNYISGYEQL